MHVLEGYFELYSLEIINVFLLKFEILSSFWDLKAPLYCNDAGKNCNIGNLQLRRTMKESRV
jgi:hypothetical protein